MPGLCLGSLTGIPLVADVDMYCVDVADSWYMYMCMLK